MYVYDIRVETIFSEVKVTIIIEQRLSIFFSCSLIRTTVKCP